MNRTLKITFAESEQEQDNLENIFNLPFSMQNLEEGFHKNIAFTHQNLGGKELAPYSLFGHGNFDF